MLLLIDNYDSFTYNIVQCFQILNIPVKVLRNNMTSLQACSEINPRYLVIGPGPGTPAHAGVSKNLITHFSGKIPILGVCLGHQCIGELFGGFVKKAKAPMHGKTSPIIHRSRGIFKDLPQKFSAMRYHSLIVDRERLPSCLEVTAETAQGEIMGLRHCDYAIESVQFHPESVLTEGGLFLLENFITQKISFNTLTKENVC